MKAFILGIVLIVAIAAGANFALKEIGFSQADVSKSDSAVRIGDTDSAGE